MQQKTARFKGPYKPLGEVQFCRILAKKGANCRYSPQEQKRAVLRGFPVLTNVSGRQKEPEMGLFFLKIETLLFPVSSMEDKWGRVHSFTLLFVHYLISDLLSGKEDHRHSSARVHAAPHKVEVFVFLAFLGCFEAFVFSLV